MFVCVYQGKYQTGTYRNMIASCGPDLCGPGQGTVAGPCEHGNESSGPMKSLCLTKHHALKTYWWSGLTAPRVL